MLGLVGPNALNGVRTAASSASEEARYRANHASEVPGVVARIMGFAANPVVARSGAASQSRIVICTGIVLEVAALMIAPGLIASGPALN